MLEKSLVLVKHDGVVRGLIGKIIGRLEETGLKIIGLKMIWADEKLAKNHYVVEEEWARNVFEKSKKTHEMEGKKFEYNDSMKFAAMIQKYNVDFLMEGPVIAMVVEGPNAIEIIRKIIGNTEPRQAAPGTIRGDYIMIESYAVADKKKRVVRNLVHASDSVKNAEREIDLWFEDNELHNYRKELDRHY